jgi:hypothetical protein
MNYQHKIKPLLITLLLSGAAPQLQPLSAADPEPAAEPAPWHVENAELRVPPQVYIADLKPLEITGGLARHIIATENGEKQVEYHCRLSLRSGVAQICRNALTDHNTVQEVL